MSRSLLQPVGQKRLTNVAVVRLRSHGLRFEIACYKNKVLSWRARVEKDIDEVLQSHTVYANVSKGVLANSKDLVKAFGTDDHAKICLEILEKGELQVAGKEREAHLSNQFRDIATIVMKKTVNPDTQRPFTISMIERLMREVHFAVDPHRSSKQQALELIKVLEKQFPITRARMKLQLIVAENHADELMNKLEEWSAIVEQHAKANTKYRVVCQLEPGYFRDCDALVRDLHGHLEVISMAVQREGDGSVEDDIDELSSSRRLGKKQLDVNDYLQDQAIKDDCLSDHASSLSLETTAGRSMGEKSNYGHLDTARKQMKCNTCNTEIQDATQYREHFKSEWHKHNLKRRVKQLLPLSSEEWALDSEIADEHSDLHEYCR